MYVCVVCVCGCNPKMLIQKQTKDSQIIKCIICLLAEINREDNNYSQMHMIPSSDITVCIKIAAGSCSIFR